jgi:hypothetical protein
MEAKNLKLLLVGTVLLVTLHVCFSKEDAGVCKPWTAWQTCEGKDNGVRRRQKQHSLSCRSADIQYENCLERRLQHLKIESASSDNTASATASSCSSKCSQSSCKALYFSAKDCTIYNEENFVVKTGSKSDYVSIKHPGLFYKILLDNPADVLNTTNIFHCIKQCQDGADCVAASFEVGADSGNCFLFNEKTYTVRRATKREYVTWFKTPGFVQSISLKGRHESKTVSNPHECIAACRALQFCKGITYVRENCHLHEGIASIYASRGDYSAISWFRYQK